MALVSQHANILACFVIAIGLLLSGCSTGDGQNAAQDPLGIVDIAPKAPIRIGAIQALTGKVSILGYEQLRGFELALVRRDGKILGHPVELMVEDSGCRPEGGANAALRIVSDPSVVAIFGTTCSGDAAAAAKVMTGAGLSMISGNNSAPFLTSVGGKPAPRWQPGYFRTAPNEEHSGPAAARYAYTALGVRSAAIIQDGDIYTSGLAEGFRREFEQLGGRVGLFATVDKGDADMKPVLEAVVAAKVGLVFFPLFQPEGNYLLQAARSMPALEHIILMSDGSLIDNTFIKAMGDLCVGMYFVGPTPPAPNSELAALQEDYERRFGSPPPTSYYQNAYDAAGILFDALERVAVRRPDGSLRIGRQALRDALANTRDYHGITGKLTCGRYGDCATPRFNILRMKDPAAGVTGLQDNVLFTYTGSRHHD